MIGLLLKNRTSFGPVPGTRCGNESVSNSFLHVEFRTVTAVIAVEATVFGVAAAGHRL
jgi:hypothetical protein